MPSIDYICSQLCHDMPAGVLKNHINYKEMIAIASQLAQCLQNKNAVNTVWQCHKPKLTKESILSFLYYLDDTLINELLIQGLDLNIETDNGKLALTNMIGCGENDFVAKLLDHAKNHQSLEQRLVWINKTDATIRTQTHDQTSVRLCYGLFCPTIIVSEVKQTPLQLTIAKGYIGVNGNGFLLAVSNLELAEKLLCLGANTVINYQEPTKGNTALHIAYARRDDNAIALLNKYGASKTILNKDGATPPDMLSLSFDQAEKLMVFHTSPHEHSHTYRLDEDNFQESQTIITDDIDTQTLAYELKALRFSQALGALLLTLCHKKIKWLDFYAKIEKAYQQAGGELNIYLPRFSNHITEAQYATLVASIEENKDAYENELRHGEITHEIANKIKLYKEPPKTVWEKIRAATVRKRKT